MSEPDYLNPANRVMPKFLELPRLITYDFHVYQAKNWLAFDNGRELDNVLVYACFELRCAIERYLFEFLILINDGKSLTPEEEEKCKSKEGLWAVLKEKEPYYRKRVKFTEIYASTEPSLPKIKIMEIGYLQKQWHALSKYCHKQIIESLSFGNEKRAFQKEGFALLKTILDQIDDYHKSAAFGLVYKGNMTPAAQQIYQDFMDDKIDEGQCYRLLKLI